LWGYRPANRYSEYMSRVLVAMLAAGAAFAAAPPITVQELVARVQKGLAHESDSRVARDIHKIRLSERLDERVIEELESAGAGPKTVEELGQLRDESVALGAAPPPPEFPSPPRPSFADQTAVLNAAARYAFQYTDSLPDFLCDQTVRRYERLNGQNGWDLKDTLTVKLSYFDHEENYKLAEINGRATNRSYDTVGGALSKGEFASLQLSIFDPEVGAHFRWDHWTTLRKRVTHVYSYIIEQGKSHYHLSSGFGFGPLESTLVGETGFVYIDRESGRVTRIIDDAVIPEDFPVRQADRVLDYDFTAIAGKPFLLPLHADIRMATAQIHTRNVVQFTGYRKFTGESTITFK